MRFGEHVYRTSDRMRRTKILYCIIAPASNAAIAASVYWANRTFNWLFILFALITIASAVLFPSLIDRVSLKAIYRRYMVRPEADDSGDLQLLVSNDSITEIAPTKQTKFGWSQIHKVEILEDRTYIYTSYKSAIIIPRHTFGGDATYNDLQAELFKHVPKPV
jgi:hypothetical protein